MAYPDLFILKKGSYHLERAVLFVRTLPFILFYCCFKTTTRSSYQQQALVICIVDFDPKQTIVYRFDCFIPKRKRLTEQVD